MKLLTHSRLFGVLLIAASMPMDPGVALAVSAASAALEAPAPTGAPPPDASIEARLQRIAAAVREQQVRQAEGVDGGDQADPLGDDAISYVVVGPGGIGWNNGGWGNGGFYNGGWGNGGFRNGGFYNGGFRNGGFYNGGFGNGGGWRNGGFRNGGFRNHW
jgi:rSAM-associated Gly-rich repeat protein